MATQPNPLPANAALELEDEPRLSYDEGWDLIFSLFGSAGDMYAKVGGADAFMREERASWGEDEGV
jgi:hypothetical protein